MNYRCCYRLITSFIKTHINEKIYLLKNCFIAFFDKCPLLFFGISYLIGINLHLNFSPLLVIIILVFMLLSNKCNRYLCFIIAILGLAHASYYAPPHELSLPSRHKGEVIFKADTITPASFPKKGVVYKGTILTFTSDTNITLKNIVCSIALSEKKRPPTNNLYKINGTLFLQSKYRGYFKAFTDRCKLILNYMK